MGWKKNRGWEEKSSLKLREPSTLWNFSFSGLDPHYYKKNLTFGIVILLSKLQRFGMFCMIETGLRMKYLTMNISMLWYKYYKDFVNQVRFGIKITKIWNVERFSLTKLQRFGMFKTMNILWYCHSILHF
jgi:hypothetical protein